MTLSSEDIVAWNEALADLVGLRLQGIHFAMPIDLVFGPEYAYDRRPGHWLRFEVGVDG
jgi:hypothetical protein